MPIQKFERSGNQGTERLEQAISQALDPISIVPFMDGNLIEGVSVSTTELKLEHKLGREPRGWFPVRWQGQFPAVAGVSGVNLVRWQSFKVNAVGSPGAASVTLTDAPADGNRQVLIHSGQAPGSGGGIASISQTGAVWTEKNSAENSSAGCRLYMWYSDEVSGAGTGITVTAGGTSDVRGIIHVLEFSNMTSDSDPFEAATSGTATKTSTAEGHDIGSLTATSDGAYLIGAICEQRPINVCGPILIDTGGLHVLNRGDGEVTSGTYNLNQTALIGGLAYAKKSARNDSQNNIWHPTITGGTTSGCAYLYGALKPGDGSGSGESAHGLREVSRDSNFLTLVAPGSATVDLWVF